jgi:hypothetical protein
MHYRFKEGKYVRMGEVLLAINVHARIGVRLDANFAEEEAENVRRLVMIAFGRLNIPDAEPNVGH